MHHAPCVEGAGRRNLELPFGNVFHDRSKKFTNIIPPWRDYGTGGAVFPPVLASDSLGAKKSRLATLIRGAAFFAMVPWLPAQAFPGLSAIRSPRASLLTVSVTNDRTPGLSLGNYYGVSVPSDVGFTFWRGTVP